MSGQLDDKGIKPLPMCQRCTTKTAVWLVTMTKNRLAGLGAARWLLCTGCAKQTNGKRRAVKPSDY
jgi:hypothetical protein